MPTYALFAGAEHLKRCDGANFAIVNAADAAAARTRLAQLLAQNDNKHRPRRISSREDDADDHRKLPDYQRDLESPTSSIAPDETDGGPLCKRQGRPTIAASGFP